LETLGQHTIERQRDLIQKELEGRLRAEGALDFIRSNFLAPIMESVMEKSQEINVTGNVYGHIGKVSGGEYTFNDLFAIKNVVDEIFKHRLKLSLEAEQLAELELSIQTVQTQLIAQAPNDSLLRKALREVLHTLRHISEAGAAHVLVAPWLPTLEKLLH
jgi:hypothetical protein